VLTSQFTAQPEAPAFLLAGASGWAVNNLINTPLVESLQGLLYVVVSAGG
jgi:hypothetical protein